jgi:predicted negative regulator of RcsB-dependent stress response
LQQELGDRSGQANTWDSLGDAEHAVGNPDAARHAWQQALAILTELEDPDADAVRTKLAALDARPD